MPEPVDGDHVNKALVTLSTMSNLDEDALDSKYTFEGLALAGGPARF